MTADIRGIAQRMRDSYAEPEMDGRTNRAVVRALDLLLEQIDFAATTTREYAPDAGGGAIADWPYDDQAAHLLLRGSFDDTAGVLSPKPGHKVSDAERAAINYLCAEWDYGFCPTALPATARPAGAEGSAEVSDEAAFEAWRGDSPFVSDNKAAFIAGRRSATTPAPAGLPEGESEWLRERLCESIREHVYSVDDDGTIYLENVEYAVDAALAPSTTSAASDGEGR